MDANTRYLIALSGTLVIELSLLALLCRPLKLPIKRTLLVGLAANMASHGTLWLILPLLPWERWTRLGVTESGVVLFEGAIYAFLAKVKPGWAGFVVALGLNLASFLTGELVWRLL